MGRWYAHGVVEAQAVGAALVSAAPRLGAHGRHRGPAGGARPGLHRLLGAEAGMPLDPNGEGFLTVRRRASFKGGHVRGFHVGEVGYKRKDMGGNWYFLKSHRGMGHLLFCCPETPA